ncbi:ATP-binding protein [Streptomyces daliensis]|uniref:ATP-binding protein n=1 Tax=Streptomyces daliensis TaxID=299421 RepID=A0A8T4IWP9_9ACTN|nr:ATP-binding protein [Streptomyces daliensis]
MNSPLKHKRQFPRKPSSVGQARRFVRAAIVGEVRTDRADDILVCVSELATNAIKHGSPAGRDFRVRVAVEGDTLRVEVHDAGDGRPELRKATEYDDDGRGLFLVASFADDWGVSRRTGPGKVVWAEFMLTKGPAAVPC